jgi:agmatine deiminase
MITDFVTNGIYFSELLKTDKRFSATYQKIYKTLNSFGIEPKLLPKTKDIWARDYMPIQISKDKFIEYRYDPDYLQGNSEEIDSRELKTHPDIVCDAIGLKTIKTDIIIDGGNVVKSENAIILTNKVVWENERRYSEKQLIKKLHDLFEVDKVVLIPWDEECKYGHADGMLRFVNNEKVLISGFYEKADDKLKRGILDSLDEAKIDRDWLSVSDKEVEDNIAYINFLQTKDLILVPALNRTEEDDNAVEEISKHFPKYADRIENVDMREIARYDGALNCITWTTKSY